MASPAVAGTAETAVSTAGTSHAINLPASIAAGDLLILVLDKGSTAATINAHADWQELLDENSANGLYIAYRWATGSEGATTTLTSSASTRSATIAYRITGALNPATLAPQVGTTATGSSTTPDPPSVSVTGGTRDVLTIACFGRSGEEADDDTWVTGAPAGFGSLLQKACGTVGTNLGGMVATAVLQQSTATADPGTFTCATGGWRAQTIVVHPARTQTSVAEVSLASGSTPSSQTAHSIKVRARVQSGTGATIRAALYEGANNRSGDLESSALTTSLADYTLSIADANAANITDYSNLSIRFWGYSVNGGALVFEVDQLWLETPAGSGAHTLDCQPGSFSVSGTAATLAAGRVFDSQPGSYAVTGVAASVVAGYKVDAQPGAYAVTGTAATPLATRVLSADPGVFVVTGAAATVAAGLAFDAQPGAFTVTGVASSLVSGYATLADPGVFAVAGADADLVYTPAGAFTLDAQPGTFAVTGADAELLYGALKNIDAQPGAVDVTGEEATLAAGYVFSADPGAFAVSGAAATVAAGRAVSAGPAVYAVTVDDIAAPIGRALDGQPAAYTVTGTDADLVLAVPGAYVLNAETGAITVTGANATMIAAHELNAATTSYAVTGIAATLFGEHNVNAAAGTYTLSGADASVLAERLLVAQPGTYTFTGVNASIGTIFDMEIDAGPGNVTVGGVSANLVFAPGLARLTTRGGRITWNTTGDFRGENHAGRITSNKEGAVA